ncbi:MAG: TIGR02444 family protein [Alphaproteobacteria bacterium]|nr:TIGR02444 family protein [Alphaproteobacteria bacterium]
MSDAESVPLWPFVRALYDKPGVSEACLSLQARHGADVDLLIYAAWVAASGRGLLETSDLAGLRAAAAPWSAEIVLALRSVRRRLKLSLGAITAEDAAGLSRHVLAVEIEAERIQLEAWAAAAPPARARSATVRRGDVAANLAACLSLFVSGEVSKDDRDALAAIAAASVA